jgi:hypothetical protein
MEKRGHFYAPVCWAYVTEINAVSRNFSQFLGAALRSLRLLRT